MIMQTTISWGKLWLLDIHRNS